MGVKTGRWEVRWRVLGLSSNRSEVCVSKMVENEEEQKAEVGERCMTDPHYHVNKHFVFKHVKRARRSYLSDVGASSIIDSVQTARERERTGPMIFEAVKQV